MDVSDQAPARGEPLNIRFGDFILDPSRVELTLRGQPVAMRPKAYALLCYFARHPGRTLGKQELVGALWPRVVVTDDSLVQCVADLRASLGPEGASLVVTVPRHGYRFDGTVVPVDGPSGAPGASPPSPPPSEPAPDASAAETAVLPLTRQGRRPPRTLAVLGLAAVVLGVAGYWASARVLRIDKAIDRERSLAILPLVPQGRTSADVAEAMTEDLVGDIARVPGTTVIARASAAAAASQDRDARRIGRLLDVAYVVIGTVASDDGGVDIALQLVSSATGAVAWSDRWQEASGGSQAWRRDVPLRVARALDLQLTSAAWKAAGQTTGAQAIAALAHGDHLLRTSNAPADVLQARASFQQALDADPGSARAWTGMALSHLSAIQSGWAPEPSAQTEAAAKAIETALSIDSEFGLAHYAQGHLRMVRGDAAGALASYDRVLALNPSDAWAHVRKAAALLALGRFDGVQALVDRARRLSPLENTQTSYGHWVAGAAQFHLGHDDAAYPQFVLATQLNPNRVGAWAFMASIDALNGRAEAAARSVSTLKAMRPNVGISMFRVGNAANGAALRAGDERFYQGLAQAGLPP